MSDNAPVYEWRDVVEINGKHYCECFPISGEMDDDAFQLDDFFEAVAEKHGVDIDDIKTYMMDDIHFNPKELEFGAEACGCYINGVPEWCIEPSPTQNSLDSLIAEAGEPTTGESNKNNRDKDAR